MSQLRLTCTQNCEVRTNSFQFHAHSSYCFFFLVLISTLSFLIACIKPHFVDIHDSTAARTFRRIDSPPPLAPIGTDSAQGVFPPCVACQQRHVPGHCPLRLAGVEFCGLCGLAHWGGRRACPHLQSGVQISRMLEALDKSAEAPSLILGAKKYLQGILKAVARTARDERKKASLAAQPEPQIQLTSPSVGGASRADVIDLTEAGAVS